LFGSLQVGVENLLSNKEAIFRYLLIRKNLAKINNSLPFLDLSTEKSKENKVVVNQREYQSLGLYISYFSR